MIKRGFAIFLAATSLASFTRFAFATVDYGTAVQLEEQRNYTTANVHGRCGEASVNITAIADTDALERKSFYLDGQDAFTGNLDGYISTEVEVSILGPDNEWDNTVILLSEQSLVQCLSVGNGKKLLIGTTCTGNHWSCEKANYYLIDAERAGDVDTSDGCDAKCINKKLGREYIKQEN